MRRYIIKRVISIFPILIGILFLSFILINSGESDPAEVALRVNGVTPTKEAVTEMREELDLDKPFLKRFIIWITSSLKGDFGNSFINGEPVVEEVKQAIPATLLLALFSFTIIILMSVLLAIACIIFEEGIIDKVIRICIFLGEAMPSFWVGLLLIWFFSVNLNLLPTSGMESLGSIILPGVTLALAYISTYVRILRNNIIQNKRENFVLYAKARGLKEGSIIKHLLKNSLQLSITALGMSIPKLIAGTVIIENIFAWPGIGRLCVTAIFNQDYPIIQAYVFLMAVLFIVCNLLVDIFTVLLDPRLRKEA
ncbi:nickel ABC transporter permease subunit NikB [Tetragenococcus halophilus subsp. flandriensis]|uniref:nickel/cobalt ABC transporter permease n=1 Tax=Tetragenococcus halophilus TaxID=51669 RepID=UPI0023EA1597|nr:nickel/cobalt ABC transporter permease [Tetragenococcus halophilus]GMA08362.1 nickel ABC transporter permease subunit NikB [Tetragenococcus halophilus subsp. flandriensis]